MATFKRQIQSLGFSYDWSREVDTTDPAYFRWTQWIFLQLYHAWFNPESNRAEPIGTLAYPPGIAGDQEAERSFRDARRLAFVSEAPVWWCEALGTVLANEEVVDGRSEVGGHPVARKPMRQWMLRITAYAERLLRDLDLLQWTDSLKEMQRNWIGRSEGAEVGFRVAIATADQPANDAVVIRVFTTRPDTLFGATYLVLAPEHRLVRTVTSADQLAAVESYQRAVAGKSDLERTELAKSKTGVFTGGYAINPANSERIPIWVADYVLNTYGTGAIMAVPAHDTRDYEFATTFGLPIVQVVQPPEGRDWRGFVDEGVAIHSAGGAVTLDGLRTPEAKRRMLDWLEIAGVGRRTINFKLRDWLFSRQRYWGEPFPVVWRADGDGRLHHEAVDAADLPVLPPSLDDYKPTPEGQPPLARATAWVQLPDGAVREVNTMPQWAGSCWYYLRYLDARNAERFVSCEAERYWMGVGGSAGVGGTLATPGVDLYVGGTEHAVLHLLYARFWHKVLFDLGHVSTPEPFFRLVNQGLILGEDGLKMSKSRGNVVNPDDILGEYGADAFRLYEMFLGPLQDTKPWNTKGVEGVYRFLGRVWRLFVDETAEEQFEQACTVESAGERAGLLDLLRISPAVRETAATPEQLKVLHACIRKVTEDLEGLRFNTAISAMMMLVNEATGWEVRPVAVLRPFLQLLAPLAPHLAEELWSRLHTHLGWPTPGLSHEPWPVFDPALLVEDSLEVPIQVNGKLRDVVRVRADATSEELELAARGAAKVQVFLAGKSVRKVVIVPRKLVNLVVN